MTGVVVQNMASGGSATLQCSGAVRKIAVYAQRLAVQLHDSISVYGLRPAGAHHDICLCLYVAVIQRLR